MKYKNWKTKKYDPAAVADLQAQGYGGLLATALAARQRTGPAAADFLAAPLSDLGDPMALRDMDKAAARIRQALAQGERIAVYGDYDVDGITASSLLGSWLQTQGADVRIYIPDRLEEGYGLHTQALEQLHGEGVALVVTVDCGITAVEEARAAQALGLDLVITDHHECKEALPQALAVVDPKRRDCPYPDKGLAGVGVAFKLVCALEGPAAVPDLLAAYGDLVAIGTIADIMPLTGENRVLVQQGLRQIAHTKRPGLLALIEEAGLKGRAITSSTVGFTIAPRLNAAGRMGQASLAAALLTETDREKARQLAQALCQLNRERQKICNQMFEEALEMAGPAPAGPIVLAAAHWHQGVAGIVASRLTDRFGLPAVVICIEGETGRGSCRSVAGFNMFKALEAVADTLVDYGGHELAAGLTVETAQIAAFAQALTQVWAQSGLGPVEPSLEIDGEILDPDWLCRADIIELGRLEPYGMGNPQPLFSMTGVFIDAVTPIGGGKHLRLQVRKNDRSFACVFFGCTAKELGLGPGDLADIAFFPQMNQFRGTESVQLLLTDARPWQAERQLQDLRAGRTLAPADARQLLPRRKDFATLWRNLCTIEETGEVPAPGGKAGVCLAVFEELGLVQVQTGTNGLHIHAYRDRKVDLGQSEILKRLAES